MKILLKIHTYLQKNVIYVLLVVLLIIPLIIVLFVSPKKSYNWSSDSSNFTIPFSTDVNGYMYINVTVGDTSGLFLIDTGSDPTCIKESLVNLNDTTFRYKLGDAQNISVRKKLIEAQNIKIGSLEFSKLNIWPLDNDSWSENGVFYKNDSLIGVIGSTILSKFVWDFDMEKMEVSIYNQPNFPENISDSTAVALINVGNKYFVEIEINGKKHKVKIDSGSSYTLSVSEAISDSVSKSNIRITRNRKTAFMHLSNESLVTPDTSYSYTIPKLHLGNHTFTQTACKERSKNNLLGIPFFWAFERVIIDYPNHQIYFINLKDNYRNSIYNISYMDRRNIQLSKHGFYIEKPNSYLEFDIEKIEQSVNDKNETILDTVPFKYIFYGGSKIWGKSMNAIDSITSADSIRLPNGKTEFANYTVNLINK